MTSSFQSIILKLQDFWASHGCLITQPYYTQVGAGTMNPATFLRVQLIVDGDEWKGRRGMGQFLKRGEGDVI